MLAQCCHPPKKIKDGDTALNGKPISELRSVTCCMGSQWYLPPDTGECARLNPSQIGWYRFTYPRGMEGWVDLGSWLHTEMVYLPTGSHPSQY